LDDGTKLGGRKIKKCENVQTGRFQGRTGRLIYPTGTLEGQTGRFAPPNRGQGDFSMHGINFCTGQRESFFYICALPIGNGIL
jgi:hypothetical protein